MWHGSDGSTALRVGYAVNCITLLPLICGTLVHLWNTDQGRFPDSPGWRVMVGSVWTSLLLMSVIGLFHPWSLAWVLVWQFVYQVTWLLAFALYRAWRGESTTVPIGLTIYFVLLSILLPIIIPWDGLFWGCDRFD